MRLTCSDEIGKVKAAALTIVWQTGGRISICLASLTSDIPLPEIQLI